MQYFTSSLIGLKIGSFNTKNPFEAEIFFFIIKSGALNNVAPKGLFFSSYIFSFKNFGDKSLKSDHILSILSEGSFFV